MVYRGWRSVLESTTYETENGFLLIETFRKLFNPQNNGHLDQLWVAIGVSIKSNSSRGISGSLVVVAELA